MTTTTRTRQEIIEAAATEAADAWAEMGDPADTGDLPTQEDFESLAHDLADAGLAESRQVRDLPADDVAAFEEAFRRRMSDHLDGLVDEAAEEAVTRR